jgi:RNA polymerase sigma factor for flagellar operon FliA
MLNGVLGQAKGSWCATRAVREQTIRDHVQLVKYVVGRITAQLPANVDREDLVSAGILGLIKAVDRFDPGRGVKFETYATSVVRGEILDSLRARDWAPRSMRRKLRQLAEVVSRLEVRLLRAPEEEEVAAAMEMTLADYHRFLSEASAASVLSLEELLMGDESHEAGEIGHGEVPEQFADPLAIVEKAELRRLVAQAIVGLPERERTVVSLYYERELTLREIGQIMGVSESRICQMHTQACVRLRAAMQRELRVT